MKPHQSTQTRHLGRRMRSGFCAWAAVLALSVLAVTARAFARMFTFNTVGTTPTGSQPWRSPKLAAVGDFNGDGQLDAMIAVGAMNTFRNTLQLTY